jgi:hypothetical protein
MKTNLMEISLNQPSTTQEELSPPDLPFGDVKLARGDGVTKALRGAFAATAESEKQEKGCFMLTS